MEAQKTIDFINSYDSFILTTHDRADPDGLGAELLFHDILTKLGKKSRIINTAPVSEVYDFMIPEEAVIEVWDKERHKALPEQSALVILDTSDEYNIGVISDELLPFVRAVMVIDHHELNPLSALDGHIDVGASSTCEIVLGVAEALNVSPSPLAANAALTGIIYDSGSFAYPKTTSNTFRAAMILSQAGALPNTIFKALNESSSTGAVLLQKKVLSSLYFCAGGRVAVQLLRKEDLASTGASIEDSENFINLPLKSREVEVSILIKEGSTGPIRCSLRSKGNVNVSKIAQAFNGGGHLTAAGFRSKSGVEETLQEVLKKVTAALDKA